MNVDIGIKDQKQESLQDLLKGDVVYEVPFFQREYSWKKDDWLDLFDDINKTTKREGHFFGFMTFKKEKNGNVSIIEGQQRLTTVTIIISVIRDIFFSMDDLYWKKIDEENIKSEDYLSSSKSTNPKLILSELNKDFFSKYIHEVGKPDEKIVSFGNEKKTNISNILVFSCYKDFYGLIKNQLKKIEEDNERKDCLREIIKTVLRKFVVISTDVVDNKAAFNIFQTLNNRGLDLAISDLVKVHLLENAGDDTSAQEAKQKWDEIREVLFAQNINTFLRHFWLSKYGIVNESDLLEEIEQKTKTKSEVFSFLDNLKEEAEDYEAILNPRQDYWDSKETTELLKELQVLSKQMPLPLLLSACKKEESFPDVLRMCINTVFMYITITEKENKRLERTFSEIAIGIRDGHYDNLNRIRERLREMCPEEEEFKKLFSRKEIKASAVARYILEKIENYISGDKEKVIKKITLEHILPKTLNKEWEKYLEKHNMEKDDYINRIGNLTLLLGRVNKKAQNQIFTKKRDDFYKKMTQLEINKSLKDITNWNSTNIDERQKWLSEQAIKIWKL